MSNCKVALKDSTEAFSEGANIWDILWNKPNYKTGHRRCITYKYRSVLLMYHRFYCSIQALLSGCSFSSVKIETSYKVHLLLSFGRSPQHRRHNQVSPLQKAGVVNSLLHGPFKKKKKKDSSIKRWTLGHRTPSVSDRFGAKGVVHLGRGPCSQPDSANTSEAHHVFTELSGHHSFPAGGKTQLDCTSRGECSSF